MTHHKSNQAVEGEAGSRRAHDRGMPRRPDAEELARRTMRDREEAGLPAGGPEDPDAVYRAVHDEVDVQAADGSLATGTARRNRGFPPTRY